MGGLSVADFGVRSPSRCVGKEPPNSGQRGEILGSSVEGRSVGRRVGVGALSREAQVGHSKLRR